jgi:hypothetical protein
MRQRITRSVLLALLAAAALARAELGPNTEASVLFTQAFPVALVPALAAGWIGAPAFGSAAPARLAAAAGTVVLALALGLLAVWAAGGQGPFELLERIFQSPLGWGAALAAFGLTQLLAWQQAQPKGSRR